MGVTEKNKMQGINCINILDRCNKLLRGIVNLGSLPSKHNFFGLGSEKWHTLCCAMDLFDNTELAKKDYNEIGLSNSFLRLYGIANTFYLQEGAIIELQKIIGIINKAEKKEFDNLNIMRFRHIIGSHTMNYNEHNKEYSAYMITASPFCLGDRFVQFCDKNTKFEKIDIDDGLNEFNLFVATKFLNVLKYLWEKQKDKDFEFGNNQKEICCKELNDIEKFIMNNTYEKRDL